MGCNTRCMADGAGKKELADGAGKKEQGRRNWQTEPSRRSRKEGTRQEELAGRAVEEE